MGGGCWPAGLFGLKVISTRPAECYLRSSEKGLCAEYLTRAASLGAVKDFLSDKIIGIFSQ